MKSHGTVRTSYAHILLLYCAATSCPAASIPHHLPKCLPSRPAGLDCRHTSCASRVPKTLQGSTCSRAKGEGGPVLQLNGTCEAAAHLAMRRAPCRRVVQTADPGRIHAPDSPERSLNTSSKQSQALLSSERGNQLGETGQECRPRRDSRTDAGSAGQDAEA